MGDSIPVRIQLIRTSKKATETGIGYYSDFLEKELNETEYGIESLSPDINRNQGLKSLIIDNIIKPITAIFKGYKQVDIIHATAEPYALFLPFAKAKRILTFHHVIKTDDETHKLWRFIWYLALFSSKVFVDEFIAISSQTKKDMIKRLKIPEDKITVISHPPKFEMFVEDIPKENTVVFVSTLIQRKNPEAALLVFEEMLKRPAFRDYRLVICGTGPRKEVLDDMILEMGLHDSIDMVDTLSVEELRNLYNRSRFLLNTSSFEGLGITTLEAQTCGTPVLYFKDADLPSEVMVAAIPCIDISDMADKAVELLEDDELMSKVIDRGIEFSKEFGKDYKEKLLEVYNKN